MTWDKFITTNTEVPLKWVIKLARVPSHTEALFQRLFSPETGCPAEMPCRHVSWLPRQWLVPRLSGLSVSFAACSH